LFSPVRIVMWSESQVGDYFRVWFLSKEASKFNFFFSKPNWNRFNQFGSVFSGLTQFELVFSGWSRTCIVGIEKINKKIIDLNKNTGWFNDARVLKLYLFNILVIIYE
jgi:hypothetical protein